MSAIMLLFPDFTLILLGIFLYRFAGLGNPFWNGLERLVYFVLFPALLFYSTASAQLDFSGTRLMLVCGAIAFCAGILLGWLARPLFRPDATLFASGVQTAFRFNSYIALAIAGRLGGDAGIALMALLIGVHVPIANAAAVYALASHAKLSLWGQIVRNPLILATICGLSQNLAGLALPEFVALTLSRLGNASIALGLIAVGAGLRLKASEGDRSTLAWFITVKLLMLPALALALAWHFELPDLQRQIVVMFAALPTASSAYVLAQRMGGNGAVVAFLISAGTLASAATLPMWLWLAR